MDYDKKMEEVRKTNSKYIKEFHSWLKKKGLAEKTIQQHTNNVEFYINDFLNYYDFTDMSEGTHMIDNYLGDWFIRKCTWSYPSTIRSTAASLKKFYQCMSELRYVTKDSYDQLCCIIKENMDSWIETVEEYNSDDDDFLDAF